MNISALKHWCSEHILGLTKRVRHTDLNQRLFARFCLKCHCIKPSLWISMIFTSSQTHVLSYIFWKFKQTLWVGIFILWIDFWHIFQMIWKILSKKLISKYTFLHFVRIDMIFNQFLCIDTLYCLISDNKIVPSNNKITLFLLIYWMTSTLSLSRWISHKLLFSKWVYLLIQVVKL